MFSIVDVFSLVGGCCGRLNVVVVVVVHSLLAPSLVVALLVVVSDVVVSVKGGLGCHGSHHGG